MAPAGKNAPYYITAPMTAPLSRGMLEENVGG